MIKIAFLDVGQADTIVISCATTNEAIVVDCTNADAVLDYLEKEHIIHLRGILITHLHIDHYGQVDRLLYRYNLVSGMSECERIGFSFILDKGNYDRLLQDADEHSLHYLEAIKKGRRLIADTLQNIRRWCEMDVGRYRIPQVQGEPQPLPFNGTLAKYIHLIHPYAIDVPSLESRGLNNTSVVLRVTGPNSSALLTGDLEPKGWEYLKARYPNLRCDVLKFPHHGGAWREVETNNLLDTLKPSTVIISVGTDGKKYNHPNPGVFTALRKRPDIRLLCTQATDQCQPSVHTERSGVVGKFQAQSAGRLHQLILSRHGCPCAGTVIIELGEEVRVVQPTVDLHHTIIKDHFRDHQCNLEPAISVVADQLEVV